MTRREFNIYLLAGISMLSGLQLFSGKRILSKNSFEKRLGVRKLGNTGIKITGVTYCARFLSDTGWEPAKRALDLGINYIDTSPSYNSSEEIIGKNLSGSREKVYLSTRWFADENTSCETLLNSFGKSLQNLGTNYIDIILIDNVKNETQLKCRGIHEAFNKLRRQNKVGFLGYSTSRCDPDLLKATLLLGGFDVILLDYNIYTYKELRKPVEALYRRGVGIIATNVLEASYKNPSLARRLFGKKDSSLTKASIKWALSENGITSVLCPFTNIEEIEECIQAAIEQEDEESTLL